MFSKFVRHVGTNELHVGKIKFLVVKIDVGVGKNEIDVKSDNSTLSQFAPSITRRKHIAPASLC